MSARRASWQLDWSHLWLVPNSTLTNRHLHKLVKMTVYNNCKRESNDQLRIIVFSLEMIYVALTLITSCSRNVQGTRETRLVRLSLAKTVIFGWGCCWGVGLFQLLIVYLFFLHPIHAAHFLFAPEIFFLFSNSQSLNTNDYNDWLNKSRWKINLLLLWFLRKIYPKKKLEITDKLSFHGFYYYIDIQMTLWNFDSVNIH